MLCTGSAPVGVRELRREVDNVAIPTPKQSPIDNHSKMKTEFPPRESHWGNTLLLRVAACMLSSRGSGRS